MKFLIAATLLVLGLQAHAHKTVAITEQTATHPKMKEVVLAVNTLAKALDRRYANIGGGTVSRAYRVTLVKPAPRVGETSLDTLERVLKSSLHADYPITGDDGGYGFGVVTDTSIAGLQDVLNGMINRKEFTSHAGTDAQFDQIEAALQAINGDPQFVALTGYGQGNNTTADIFAILDVQNQEYIYIMDSNFGSDD